MSKISRSEVFDKNLNFLIGSGASFGLFPTLGLKLKNSKTKKPFSLEELATHFEDDPKIHAQLFSWYIRKVIAPSSKFDLEDFFHSTVEEQVIENYQKFLMTILTMLSKRPGQKKANIFTTNYDGLVAHVAEKMLNEGTADFVLNDGGNGFRKRTLGIQNFSRYYRHQGVFDRHSVDVTQINLLQLHGSVYWYKDGEDIEISYDLARAEKRIDEVPTFSSDKLDKLLDNEDKDENDLRKLDSELGEDKISKFWEAYDKLPIVNPTKWKFNETVFEEHYYQSLRLLSYELEKPDTVFVVFGFSFADEHILNLVKRSLSNPTLKVFICCFNERNYEELNEKFRGHPTVELIQVDKNLTFEVLNDEVFSAELRTGIDE
ncbi:SIR2 family protein [Hoeflea prorocentri]|uniref:SIR2 family protein n=1 Tax=Hoeflea prorocentri TaxID=1922333 RepID=A0A9X3UJD5_9HYPH|nr:SIR2 family protein [Hoeflea prorocentri]MCY6382442.1 SIR2 family protein [Hoeflea prorocentri]MDA5400242.1 SIR2 family protein [Hoeflea prorocentri]